MTTKWTLVQHAYSDKEAEHRKIDFFLPRKISRDACLLFIHGGGFVGGSKESWHPVAAHFASLGYAAATVSYRLAPDHIYPAQIEDVRLAMQHVKQKAESYGYRPDRIIVVGSSAGGHLCLMLATIGADDPLGRTPELLLTDTRPHAVVCYCPVTTMALERKFVPIFMGGSREDKKEAYAQASPIQRVKGGEPPLLLLQGEEDQTTPLDVVKELHEKWKESGNISVMHTLPGVKHGFGYGVQTEAQKQCLAYIEQFLQEEFVLSAAE